jgi:hypothetical protein
MLLFFSVVLIKVLIDPSKYLDSAKKITKLKHTKASFSTSAVNGPKNKLIFSENIVVQN